MNPCKDSVPGVDISVHVMPPSEVLSTKDSAKPPTMKPFWASWKKTACKDFVVPVLSVSQVVPPFVVLYAGMDNLWGR